MHFLLAFISLALHYTFATHINLLHVLSICASDAYFFGWNLLYVKRAFDRKKIDTAFNTIFCIYIYHIIHRTNSIDLQVRALGSVLP